MEAYPIVPVKKGEIMPVRGNYERKPKNLGELVLYLSELKHRGVNPSERYDISLKWAALEFGVSWDGIKKVVGLDSLLHPRRGIEKAAGDFLRGNPSSYREIDGHLKQLGFNTNGLSAYLRNKNFGRAGKLGNYIYYVKDDPDALKLVRKRLEIRWMEKYGNLLSSISEPVPLSDLDVDKKIVSDLVESGKLVVLPKPVSNPFWDKRMDSEKNVRHRITEGPLYVIKEGQEQEFAGIVLDGFADCGLNRVYKSNFTRFVKRKDFPEKIQEAIKNRLHLTPSKLQPAELRSETSRAAADYLKGNPSTTSEIRRRLEKIGVKPNMGTLFQFLESNKVGYVGKWGSRIYYLKGDEKGETSASVRMYMSTLFEKSAR